MKRRRPSAPPAPEPAQLPRGAWAVATALAVFVFLLYLRTLFPCLSPVGDAAELSTAAAIPGIAHPPGYPLYTLLGHLFSRLAPANAAWGLNVMSAFWGALAAAAALLVVLRLTGSLAPSVAAGLFLAFSPLAWRLSVTAEVFTMNLFMGLLLIYLMVTWSQAPERRGYLAASYLAMGLALAHHHTIVLLAPALLFLQIATQGTRAFLAFLPRGLVLTALGLLPYLYLPLRAGDSLPLNWGDPSTLQGFLWTVTRTGYGTGALFPGASASAAPDVPSALGDLAATLASSPCRCFPLLAPLGLIFLFIKNRKISIFLLLVLLCAGPLFLFLASPPNGEGYRALTERFHLLPLGAWALLMGTALDFFLRLLRRAHHRMVLGLFILLIPGIPMLAGLEEQDFSRNRLAVDYGRHLLRDLPRDAVLVVTTDLAMGCAYYGQSVEKERPDVAVVNRGFLASPWYLRQLGGRHPGLLPPGGAPDRDGNLRALVEAWQGRRPICFDDYLREYGRRLVPAGATYRLLAPSRRLPPDPLRDHLALLPGEKLSSPLDTTAYRDFFSRDVVRRYARASFNLAYLLDAGGEAERAEEAYRLSLRQDPLSAMAWDNLGGLLYRSGRLVEAEEALRRSLAIREHAVTWSALSLVYRAMGQARKAEEAGARAEALRAR